MAVRDQLNFPPLNGAKIQKEDHAEALKIQVENQWTSVDFLDLYILTKIYYLHSAYCIHTKAWHCARPWWGASHTEWGGGGA